VTLYKEGPKAYLAGTDLGKGRALVLSKALMPPKRGRAEVGRVCRLGEAVWMPRPCRLYASFVSNLPVAEHGLLIRPFADLIVILLRELLAVVTLGALLNRPTPSPYTEPPLNTRAGFSDSSPYTGAL